LDFSFYTNFTARRLLYAHPQRKKLCSIALLCLKGALHFKCRRFGAGTLDSKRIVLLFFLMVIGVCSDYAQTTSLGDYQSVGSGNWSDLANWQRYTSTGWATPSAGDGYPGQYTGTGDVWIQDGTTITINVSPAQPISGLYVGKGTSGILQYEADNARTIAVRGIVTIAHGAVFCSASTGTVTTHQLVVETSIINRGTINFSNNTAGVGITFSGDSNGLFDLSAATQTNLMASNGLILDKGTNVLSFTPGGLFQVRSVNTEGFLTIQSGTFSLIGENSFSNPLFYATTGSYTIPLGGGFTLNNHNANVSGIYGTLTNNGDLIIRDGVFNIGNGTGNESLTTSSGRFEMSGGILNISGRFRIDGGNCIINGGELNLATIGHADRTLAAFHISGSAGLTISGNSLITFAFPNSNTNPFNDLEIVAGSGTKTITGGTFQLGTSATPSTRPFLVNSDIPLYNMVVYTPNTRVVLSDHLTINNQLTLNGQLLINNYNLNLGPSVILGDLRTGHGMILSGTGQIHKTINAPGTYLFPFGTGGSTSTYIPVTLTFTSGSFSPVANVSVGMTPSIHPHNFNTTNYLKRYWTVQTSGITNPVYNFTGTYANITTDVEGQESYMTTGVYTTLWRKLSAANNIGTTISASGLTENADITGINSVAAPPEVTVTPNPASVCMGSSVQLTANVTGTDPFTYSWISNPAGYTSTAFNPSVSPATSTTYTVTVTDIMGETTHESVLVSVNPILTVSVSIAAEPSGAICAGTNVIFTATPTNGGPSPTYQWYDGLNPIAGATGATYSTTTLTDGASISVRMTSNAECTTGLPVASNVLSMRVNPILSASVSIAAEPSGAICAGTNVIFTATPTNGGPSPTYQWYDGLNPIAGATGATYSTTTLTDGASISVRMTSNAECTTGLPVASNVIPNTVIPLPNATAGGSQTICVNESAVVSGASSSNGSILWTHDGAGTITAGATTLTPTYTAAAADAGHAVVLTLTVTGNDACNAAKAIATYTINVPPTPTVTSPGNRVYCQGETTTVIPLTGSPAGVVFDITGGTAVGLGSQNGGITIPSFTATVGSTIVTITPRANNCTGTPITFTITVNPATGAATFTGGPSEVCQDAPNTPYTAMAANSTSITYTRSPVTAGNINPITGEMDWFSNFNGPATIIATANGLCGSTTTSKEVMVHPTPVATSPGAQTYCEGVATQPMTLTGTPSGVTFDITGGSAIGLPDYSGVTAIPSFTPVTGNATITLTPKANNCPGSPVTFTTTVRPTPTATISGGTTVCRGTLSAITISNAQSSGISVTYNINGGNNITIPVSGVSAFINVPTNISGTFTYNLVSVQYQSTPNCPHPVNGSATVVVLPVPTATVSENTTVCQGEAAPLVTFTNPQAFPIRVTYSINGTGQPPVDVNAGATTSVSAPTNTPGTFIYNLVSVAYRDGTACSNSMVNSSATITVRPVPTVNISGNATVCQYSSPSPIITISNPQATAVRVTYRINNEAPVTQNIPANGSIIASVNTSTPGSTTYTLVSVQYQSAPDCPNTVNGSATVVVLPVPTATVSGTTSVCLGDAASLVTFTNPQALPIRVTYNINGTEQPPVDVNAGATASVSAPTNTPGTFIYNLVSVAYRDGTACSNSMVNSSATITVRPVPTVNISGNATVCQYSSPSPTITISNPQAIPIRVTYTINNGTPVTRDIPVNGSFLASVNTSTPGSTTYNLVSVQYQSGPNCSNMLNGFATVEVRPTPQTSISGTKTVCQGDAAPLVTFTNPQALPIRVTYNINGTEQPPVEVNAGATATVTTPTNNPGTFIYNLVNVAYRDGTVCINNAVNSSATITVHPHPTVSSPVNQIFCVGKPTTVIPLDGNPTGVVFDVSGGEAIGLTNQTGVLAIPSFNPIAGTATLLITPRANNCTGDPVSFTITVSNPPIITCPADLSVCYSTSSFALPAATPAGGIYRGTGVTGNTFNPVTAGIGTHLITYSYTDAATTCENSCTFSIAVKAVPVIPNQSISSCDRNTFVVNPQDGIPLGTIVPLGTTYSWPAPTVSPANSVTGSGAQSGRPSISQTLTLTNPNQAATITYQVTPTVNGCPGTTFTVVVIVHPNPMRLNATFHQQYINDPAYDILEICDGQSVYNVPDNDLEVFYWDGNSWEYPAPGIFNNYTWGWQYSVGTDDGPWLAAVGVVTANYEYKMPAPPSIFSQVGDYYFRFYITNSNGCTTYTDIIHLIISSTLILEAGDPITVECSASPAAIPLTGASIAGTPDPRAKWAITSLNPTNSGDGTLSSTDFRPDPYNVTYIPPANYSGIVTLTLTSTDPSGDCRALVETRTITILSPASAFAGNPQSVCAYQTVQLNGILEGSAPGATWSVSPAGSGTFSNPNSLTATFTPTIASGTVTLTLTPNLSGACVNASSVVIIVNPAPQASGITICQGESGSLNVTTACPSLNVNSGAYFPRTGATIGGSGTAWSNPGNILTNNNSYATVSGAGDAFSKYLYATNFGFQIPAGAMVNGIQVAIGRFRSGGLISGEIRDNVVSLLRGGTIIGANRAINTNWPTSKGAANYGSGADNWGTTWTAADINANNFGVALRVSNTSGFWSRTANVDYITVTVVYTINGTINWYTSSTGGSPIGSGSTFNPVGVAGSGLTNTNMPGTYTFYAECTSFPGCRTAASFVIQSKPIVNHPVSLTSLACSYADQAALNAAFSTWLSGFSVSGGVRPAGSFQGGGTPTAPALCTGGAVTAVFNYADNCETSSVQSTFTITGPSVLNITNPGNVTRSACDFANQSAVNAAFSAWVAGFGVSGGCNPKASFSTMPIAPDICGGSVTATYNVSDLCAANRSETAIFTVIGTSGFDIEVPEDVTRSSCDYANQEEVDDAFASWLTGFHYTGGCAGSGSYGTPTAPSWCNGGITEVTLYYSDICRNGSKSAKFIITPPNELVVSKPNQVIRNSSEFADQAAVDAAFAAWLTGFGFTGGCSPSGSYGTPIAPELCTGGTVTVTYQVADDCQSESVTETFRLVGPVALFINKPAPFEATTCDYATQEDLNSVFENWLLGFYASGGSNPKGSFGVSTPAAPDLCQGGATTVTYTVTDICESGSQSATFTINRPEALVIHKPDNFGATTCVYASQEELNQAFTHWLAGFSVTGGCSQQGVFAGGTPTTPDLCLGGTVTATYKVNDVCNSDSPSATFSVPAVPDLIISAPENITQNSCQTQAAIDAAFNEWIKSFGYKGGCAVTASALTGFTPPSAEGGSVEVNYSVYDNCGQADYRSRTFTVTNDTADPVITCPLSPVGICANSSGTYTHLSNSWDATATDNCSVVALTYTLSGSTTGTGSSLNGVVFNSGTTHVVWHATDSAGNPDECTFDVTVHPLPSPSLIYHN
jgi:hypothetical protein